MSIYLAGVVHNKKGGLFPFLSSLPFAVRALTRTCTHISSRPDDATLPAPQEGGYICRKTHYNKKDICISTQMHPRSKCVADLSSVERRGERGRVRDRERRGLSCVSGFALKRLTGAQYRPSPPAEGGEAGQKGRNRR